MINFLSTLMQYIVSVCFDLIIFIVLFFFLIELSKTHVHHPIRQAILRYMGPLIDPIHKAFPVYRDIDTGLLFLLFVFEIIKLSLMFILVGQFPIITLLFFWSILIVINAFLNFCLLLMLFRLIISWMLPIYSNHPAVQLLFILSEPILKPIRHLFPTIKGFDWTPLAVIIVLKILSSLIVFILMQLGAPAFIL